MSDPPLILIVEDDPTVQNLLRTIMETEGYDAITAADGLEGLLKAEIRHPSVIILDIMMPNVDGERVLEEMRTRSDLSAVPVLIVTGRADAHDAFDRLVGARNVITKPFDPDQLTGRVAELLAGKGA
ncbi:MAG TPA: response regulator [Actinomycetota bacterium]|nr:response regulator [Actinomycetota bacterium]